MKIPFWFRRSRPRGARLLGEVLGEEGRVLPATVKLTRREREAFRDGHRVGQQKRNDAIDAQLAEIRDLLESGLATVQDHLAKAGSPRTTTDREC